MMSFKSFLFIPLLSSILARAAATCLTTDGHYYYQAYITVSTSTPVTCTAAEQTAIGSFLKKSFDQVAAAGAYVGPLNLNTSVCQTPVLQPPKMCCSWDYKTCGSPGWCDALTSNCEGNCQGTYINPLLTTKCLALWQPCSVDSDCCGYAKCFTHVDGWKGCEPFDTTLTPGIKEPGCCSYDMKTCSGSTFCDLNSKNCVSSCSGNFINNTNLASSTCLPRYSACHYNTDCCSGMICNATTNQCNLHARRMLRKGSQEDTRGNYHGSSVDVRAQHEPPVKVLANAEQEVSYDQRDDVYHRNLLPTTVILYKGSGTCRLCTPDNTDRRHLQLPETSSGGERRLGTAFTSVESTLKLSLYSYLTSALAKNYTSNPSSCYYRVNATVNTQLTQTPYPVTSC